MYIWYAHIGQKCLYTCICIHKWAKYSISITYLFLRFKWMSTPTLSWDEKQTHTYTSVLDCGVRLGDFAATRLSYCVIPVLCVALLVFLFVNNGLAARVYDHQTLVSFSSECQWWILVPLIHGLVLHIPYRPHLCQRPAFPMVVSSTKALVNTKGDVGDKWFRGYQNMYGYQK